MGNDTNVNIGNSGEYFVAGELERRGYTVAVPKSGHYQRKMKHYLEIIYSIYLYL